MYIPSELGYGDGGSPPKIGGGDVLIFTMEILAIQGGTVKALQCSIDGDSDGDGCNEKERAYTAKVHTLYTEGDDTKASAQHDERSDEGRSERLGETAGELWAANIIQVLLTYTIELWEERNQDVHGRTTTEQKQKLLDKHRITMQDLEERYKHEIQVVDSHIFSDFHTTISHDNPQVLANWIATRRPTIIRSARRAQTIAAANTPSIINWF